MEGKDFDSIDRNIQPVGDRFENTYKTPDEIERLQQDRYEEDLKKEEAEKMQNLTEEERARRNNAQQIELGL